MQHGKLLVLSLLVLTATAACSAAGPSATATPTAAIEPSSTPPDIGMPVPSTDSGPTPGVTETVVTDLTTHTDEAYGYSFDYPSIWSLDGVVLGSRAPAGYQLTSWGHEPGVVSEVPPDETIMNIRVQLWDPKADLAAFVEHQKSAWDGSGIQILSEEDVTLANGQPAKEFVVKGSDGAEGYFLFSVLGENYLVASGNGNIEFIRQVARSLR